MPTDRRHLPVESLPLFCRALNRTSGSLSFSLIATSIASRISLSVSVTVACLPGWSFTIARFRATARAFGDSSSRSDGKLARMLASL